jgi:hypothetical protein
VVKAFSFGMIVGVAMIRLPKKVGDIIQNQQWSIPPYLDNLYPTLKNWVMQIELPVDPLSDMLVWMHSDKSGAVMFLLLDPCWHGELYA